MKGLLYKLHLENIKFRYVFIMIIGSVLYYLNCFEEIEDVSFLSVGGMIAIFLWNISGYSNGLQKEDSFICTLPVKKSQVVSSKYIYHSICKCFPMVLFLVLEVAFSGIEVFPEALVFVAFCLIGSSFSMLLLPFLFRGLKLLFTLLVIVVVTFSGIASVVICSNVIKSGANLILTSIVIILASVAIYVASWFLSVLAYENREF
ncbi:MAG: hypothetical protein E7614_07820 [Ruminococcaceae bacterium]|nr:hypothetical protein [Oscillospiraceae bacterium]